MTSELKPCPFCGGKADPEGWSSIDRKGPACDDCYASADTIERWNTRATPSADLLAGLVRYDEFEIVRAHEAGEMPDGGDTGIYVLHSEAAKVIDLMKHDEVSYRSTIEHLKQRAEAAEAKLVKYEDQLPIGYITPKAQLSLLQEFSTSDSISPVKMGECRIAIYDSPAPVSDSLKAENDELRGQAMRIIIAFDPDNDLDNPEKFNAYFDLKAALNVEASNDKG